MAVRVSVHRLSTLGIFTNGFRHSQFANRIKTQCCFLQPVTLKPQDLLVLLKMVALGREPWSYNQLAYELGMSASEVHAGVKRAAHVGFMQVKEGWGHPDVSALSEFLVHGLRYAFAPERRGMVQGLPTAYSAAPLKDRVDKADDPPAPARSLGSRRIPGSRGSRGMPCPLRRHCLDLAI